MKGQILETEVLFHILGRILYVPRNNRPEVDGRDEVDSSAGMCRVYSVCLVEP